MGKARSPKRQLYFGYRQQEGIPRLRFPVACGPTRYPFPNAPAQLSPSPRCPLRAPTRPGTCSLCEATGNPFAQETVGNEQAPSRRNPQIGGGFPCQCACLMHTLMKKARQTRAAHLMWPSKTLLVQRVCRMPACVPLCWQRTELSVPPFRSKHICRQVKNTFLNAHMRWTCCRGGDDTEECKAEPSCALASLAPNLQKNKTELKSFPKMSLTIILTGKLVRFHFNASPPRPKKSETPKCGEERIPEQPSF